MTNQENKTSTGSKSGLFASSLASILLLAVILIAVNYISGFLYLRGDMTEEKLFTLSQGTKSMLGKLEDKARIRFYFSKSMPNVPFAYKLYGKRVEELLDEYVAYSNDRIELEVSDPQPDTDVEEWAVRYGLAQAALPGGDKFYLGMVVIVADQEEVIPFFSIDREEFLEYDITRAITQAASSKKAVVGVMSPLPIISDQPLPFQMQQGQQPQDWLFINELKKTFEVRKISPDADKISDDISLLMVIHPKSFSESATYAIDQYVLKGGRAIVMVDPSSRADEGDQGNPYMAMMNRSSDLPQLFKAWNISYDKSRIAADMSLATQVNFGRNGVMKHPMWLSLTGETLSKDSVVSAKLGTMMMVEPGAISQAQDGEHEFIPLIQTSEGGSLVESHRLMSHPDELIRQLPTTGSKQTLAALTRGSFSSAFSEPPALPVPEDETDAQKAARKSRLAELGKAHISKAASPVTVMIIADTDFLQNDFSVRAVNFFGSMLLQPINDNLAFISNSVDYLAGSEDLIAVRSRGKSTRTFDRVEAIEREAQRKWQEEEKNLTRRLEEIQTRINELQARRQDGERLILTAEQREEITRAQSEKSETMRRRREIRKLLRQDIERLGMKITFVNLLFMPLLVTIFGAVFYLRQNKKRGMA